MAGEDFLLVTILEAGDMTGDLTSRVVELISLDNIGFQFIYTGVPTGTFAIDITADNPATSNNWTTLPITPTPTASGGPDNNYVEVIQTTARWIRARYVSDASVGTLKIILSGKMV